MRLVVSVGTGRFGISRIKRGRFSSLFGIRWSGVRKATNLAVTSRVFGRETARVTHPVPGWERTRWSVADRVAVMTRELTSRAYCWFWQLLDDHIQVHYRPALQMRGTSLAAQEELGLCNQYDDHLQVYLHKDQACAEEASSTWSRRSKPPKREETVDGGEVHH